MSTVVHAASKDELQIAAHFEASASTAVASGTAWENQMKQKLRQTKPQLFTFLNPWRCQNYDFLAVKLWPKKAPNKGAGESAKRPLGRGTLTWRMQAPHPAMAVLDVLQTLQQRHQLRLLNTLVDLCSGHSVPQLAPESWH